MTGKAQERAAVALAFGPEVIDITKAQSFNSKAQFFEAFNHQVLAAIVVGRYRLAGNEGISQNSSGIGDHF